MPLQPSLFALSRRGLLATVGVSILSCRNVADGGDDPGAGGDPDAGGTSGGGALGPPDLAALRTPPTFPTEGVTVEAIGGVASLTEDGATNMWSITASDRGEFDGTLGDYPTLAAVVSAVSNAQDANGGLDAVIRLPAVEAVTSESPGYGGTRLALVGQVDGNGEPTTRWKPGGVHNGFGMGGGVTSEVWMKNIWLGSFPSEVPGHADKSIAQVGDTGVYMGSAGDLVMVNCRVFGFSQDGIESTNDSWLDKSKNTRALFYDCEFAFNGGGSRKHNIYVHALAELRLVRCLSYAPYWGHAVKSDCEKLTMIDCFTSNRRYRDPVTDTWGNIATRVNAEMVNFSRAADVLLVNNVFESDSAGDANPRSTISSASRKTKAFGDFSLKVPPPFDEGICVTNDFSSHGEPAWESQGGSSGWSLTSYAAQSTSAGATAGDTVVPIRRLGPWGQKQDTPVDDIPAGTSIDVAIAADGQYQYVTGAEMTSTGTEGTITLPEPLAFDIPAYYSTFLIKRSTDAWDRPRLEPKFYNKSDPDYYWAKIDDGNKRPDYVNAQQHLHMQWFTDCMFLHSLGSTRSRPIRYAADEAVGINPGNSSYELLPFPPLNRPQGATAAWPDDADAGVWDVTATSNKTSVFGTDPAAGDDWLTPWVVAARNNSVRPLAGGSTTRPEGFLMADSVWGRRPYQSPVSTLHLEANGTVSDEYAYLADDNDFTPERNTDVTTTVAGAQAPADRLTVADATGIAVGDRLHVRFAPKVGAVQMHATTVTGVSGSDVLLLEPFARDLAGGEEVAVFTPAGAKPAWWNDGVS